MDGLCGAMLWKGGEAVEAAPRKAADEAAASPELPSGLLPPLSFLFHAYSLGCSGPALGPLPFLFLDLRVFKKKWRKREPGEALK